MKKFLLLLFLAAQLFAQQQPPSRIYYVTSPGSGGGSSPGGSDPDTLLLMYAEMFSASTTFVDSVGVTWTEVITLSYSASVSEINNKAAIGIASTSSYFQLDTLDVADDSLNLCIIGVYKSNAINTTQTILDFGTFELYSQSNGQTSAMQYRDAGSNVIVVPGDTTNQWRIRAFVFEDGRANLYKSGVELGDTTCVLPVNLLTSRWAIRINNQFATQDVAHISLFALPKGETFSAEFINRHANNLSSYYNLQWADITR